jgi:hypothetical protein
MRTMERAGAAIVPGGRSASRASRQKRRSKMVIKNPGPPNICDEILS